jgi:hypothetical protein
MAKNKEEEYECEVCGATSDRAKNCCGKPMKKTAHAGPKGDKSGEERQH